MRGKIRSCTAGILLALMAVSGCRETVSLETESFRDTEEIQAEEAGGAGTDLEAPGIFVHVCGAVEDPGVYLLPEGSRVHEAIREAGGFADGAAADYLNLAEELADGTKLTVPYLSELPAQEQYGETAAQEDGLVDINRAGPEELMTLPGIGETKAEAIIAYREEHGDFSSPEEIMAVPGIKEAAYERLKDKIKAGP